MTHSKQGKDLAHRLQEVLLDGKWIANTNVQDQVSLVNWEQAIQIVGSLNSIAALTFHLNYYLEGLSQVLEGGPLAIRDKYSFDLPRIKSDEDWNRLKTNFLANAQRFIDLVKLLSDDQLAADFTNPDYGTYQRNIEAVVEHSYYHLGQISLLRKWISER
ncbi:MAG: DinB family protein [Bacteroidetes bacterium]|nr:MAG: DinB family protein [Bacteroidota bacterium]